MLWRRAEACRHATAGFLICVWELHLVPSHPVSSNLTNANSEMVRQWWEGGCQVRVLKRYKRARVLTDTLLDYLERLNVRYPRGRELDELSRDAIQQVLAELPEAWRPSFPHCRTVQEALDQVFDLKGEIRRRALPGSLPASWDWDGDAQQKA